MRTRRWSRPTNSYWSGFEADDIEQYVRPHGGFAIFPTNDDLTLIVTGWPSPRFHEIREDIEGHAQKEHDQAPSVAERLKRAKREDKWYGTAGVPNYSASRTATAGRWLAMLDTSRTS